MQKVTGTNIKVLSKLSEYEAADTVDIVCDIIDSAKAESIKNGVRITRQIGKRRIIDSARNKFAHTEADYSDFKVTRIEQGQTVDNSKKEKQLEDAALSLLADLGIDWSDDEEMEEEEIEEEETQTVENEADNTVENTEEEDQQEMPEGFDSLIADIVGDTVENTKDQPIEIRKSTLTSGYWEIFEGANKIGYISSVDSPGRINCYRGGYEVYINKQKCFTGSIGNCKSYAKSKLWK